MTVQRRYPEQYPRPHLPIRDLKITSAMSTDRDYVLIGRDHAMRFAGKYVITAIAYEQSGCGPKQEHYFAIPIERRDIEDLIVALGDMLADDDRRFGEGRAS